MFVRDSELELTVCSNADYIDESNHRRSVSGTVVILVGASVSWELTTQRCVALSTTEAEYVALGDVVKEALFTATALSFICPCLLYTSPSPRD